MTDPTDTHRIVGVGLCACGHTYSLRWMGYGEWWADHMSDVARTDPDQETTP